jgi:hypothetical protein
MAKDPYEIVRRFDELPNDALIPPKPTAIILSTTDRNLRRNPPIPKRQIGARAVGFRVGDIRALVRGNTPALPATP